VQTTLLGLAITFIVALIAALIGPYFIDWNQFRPQFEAEATRVLGATVRVEGALDARLLPTPSLRLRSIVVGGANALGRVRADKLDVDFSLGSLMRGEWRATELTINGAAIDLGLDRQGRIDWPVSAGRFNLGSLAIDRLNLTGRVALHDAASRSTLELNDIAFSGDVRSLAGSVRGDGNFTLSGVRYPFRVSSGQAADAVGTRVRLAVDPGARALAADLDGILTFEARAPRFDGAITLSRPAGPKANIPTGDVAQMPWRISAKIKADPLTARLEQLETSYGPEEKSLKLAGQADIRFGASPLLHAVLSGKQLDIDRLLAADNPATDPIRILPGLRSLLTAMPQLPVAARIELGVDQIMFGGRPLQNLEADVRGDKFWAIDRLDVRAPGTTRVALNGTTATLGQADGFKGALSIDSADPDTLAGWLQGRTEIVYRSQKPLRLSGNLDVTPNRLAIDALKAEVDGGRVEGRIAFANKATGVPSRIDAALKADNLDLDAAVSFVRSLAGPQAEWPDEGQLTLDVDRAVSAGQELRPLAVQIGYGKNAFTLDRMKIGGADGVVIDGTGKFDRLQTTGNLAVNVSAASFDPIARLTGSFAPTLSARINALPKTTGTTQVKFQLDLDKDAGHAERSSARAVVDVMSPLVNGSITMRATPTTAALQGLDLDALLRSEVGVDSKLSGQGGLLLGVLGLDQIVAAGDGPAQFEGTAKGAWRTPLQVKGKLSAMLLDAQIDGVVEPWADEPKGALNVTVRHANIAPLLDLKSSDPVVRDVAVSARVTLAGRALNVDDIDGAIAGSRLRGQLKLTLDAEKTVEGQIGMDAIDFAPAISYAIGTAGHDASDPVGRGVVQGWRGKVFFQALRGTMPGGAEVRPISGVIANDGQSLTIQTTKATIGGGEAKAEFEARPTAAGLSLNARIQLTGVDGAALKYRSLAMPAGRVGLSMTLASQGRSPSALSGALSGNGSLTLDAGRISGLDARAFDIAIRASDSGQATDDGKLRQIVEPALAAGSLAVTSSQIPFVIRDGRLRVGATAIDGEGARAIVSGGYDLAADQTDVRVTLASTMGTAASRPEIQVFAVGSPDNLHRTVDVAALSSWLAVRAIDRETRRLDLLERGETPPVVIPSPAAIGPPIIEAPAVDVPTASAPALPDLPTVDIPTPGRDPRRIAPKPKALVAPRPALAPQISNAPVVSQQLAPLPPAIEVRPAPGMPRAPRLRPPLNLTPPAPN
jgi:hypothetical protein